MLARLIALWRSLGQRRQAHAVLLALATTATLIHQAAVWNWTIEDAAISYAYARNLAEGHGLVPVIGGERVEGYSNPSWVALLALFALCGAGLFSTAKILALILAALTVPLVYAIAHLAAARDDSDAPVFAVLALATNAQFAIWGGCGLENPLFGFLLAAAILRTLVEHRPGPSRRPWSALLWLALALTRPEGILYAAIGGAASMAWALRDGRGLRPTAGWLALFWVPFLAYHAVRYDYFAWALPQTAYAKLGDDERAMLDDWFGRGWTYLKNWAVGMGHGYLLPVYVIGVVGARGGRALTGIALAFLWAGTGVLAGPQRLLMATVLIFTYLCYLALIRRQEGGPRPALALAGLVLVGAFIGAAEVMRWKGVDGFIDYPRWVDRLPPYLALPFAAAIPVVAWGAPGYRARTLCWGLLAAGLGFAVAVQGDWMSGWRWMNLVAVPGSVLLGTGIEATAKLAQDNLVERPDRGWFAWAAAIALVLAPVPANVLFTRAFLADPVTGPFAVLQRVKYKNRIKERLHWYGPLDDLDVDMGAHLFWATDHRMMDYAGLVDIPFAQHRFQRDFVREYVFVERRPLFVHVHGGWAGNTRIPTHPEWKEQYFELPGYPVGKKLHPGNFLRRDAVFARAWDGPGDRSVTFDGDIELVGWDAPSPEVAASRRLYLEVGVRTPRPVPVGFRILGFLAQSDGDALWTFDLPPAYDWVPSDDWRSREVFVGRFSPRLPDDLPEGSYDLGFVMVQQGGRVYGARPPVPPGAVLSGVGPWTVRFMDGEVVFPEAITVVSDEEVQRLSREDRDRALAAARDGDCQGAIDRWREARAHRPRSTWIDQARAEVDRAIADCYVRAASGPDNEVAMLKAARQWDHASPALWAAARPVADRLIAEGHAAAAAGDHVAAYRAFSDAVAVDPTRSWARKWAERERAIRLRLDEARPPADARQRERLRHLRRQRALKGGG